MILDELILTFNRMLVGFELTGLLYLLCNLCS